MSKVLVTGGSGFIGNYIVKILAATHPEVQVVSMSRRNIDAQRDNDPQTARFSNVCFWQGDCLKPETYPSNLESFSGVVHSVGTLIEGLNYKSLLSEGISSIASGKFNPKDLCNSKPAYDESHEALNRDACKLVAEHYNNALASKNSKHKGHFVFISASPSLLPFLVKYSDMKQQAESFLQLNCPSLSPVILRPGIVHQSKERPYSEPLRILNDIGYAVNSKIIRNIPGNELVQPLLPQSSSISLQELSHFAIEGVLGNLEGIKKDGVWSNHDMKEASK